MELLVLGYPYDMVSEMLRLHGNAVDRAEEALRKSLIRDIRHLIVEGTVEGVVIHGMVKSFHHKQLAQEIVRIEIGDVELINRLQVAPSLLSPEGG